MSNTREPRYRLNLPRWARVAGWVGAALLSVAIFVQSSSTDAGDLLSWFPAGSDKLFHGAAYAVLGALFTLGTGRPWLGALLATLYGLTDEVHQYFVPGRAADVFDLLADAVGASLGAAFVAFLSRRLRGRR